MLKRIIAALKFKKSIKVPEEHADELLELMDQYHMHSTMANKKAIWDYVHTFAPEVRGIRSAEVGTAYSCCTEPYVRIPRF